VSTYVWLKGIAKKCLPQAVNAGYLYPAKDVHIVTFTPPVGIHRTVIAAVVVDEAGESLYTGEEDVEYHALKSLLQMLQNKVMEKISGKWEE
jgi:hypothetical protein